MSSATKQLLQTANDSKCYFVAKILLENWLKQQDYTDLGAMTYHDLSSAYQEHQDGYAICRMGGNIYVNPVLRAIVMTSAHRILSKIVDNADNPILIQYYVDCWLCALGVSSMMAPSMNN
jgi:hypothetical protein